MHSVKENHQTHVCHLIYSFGFGGLEHVIANLINNSNDPSIKHTIISLTDDLSFYYKVEDKAQIHSLNKQPGNDISSHVKLFKLLKTLNVDTINTYNFGTLEYQITAMLAGVKNRIHNVHGYGGDDSGGKSHKRNIFTKLVSLILYKFIIVSPDLKSWALNTVKIKNKKVELIYNGINTNNFKPITKINNDDTYTICTVGRVDPNKNHSFLIRAYALALQSCPNMRCSRLIVAGDGPSLGELKLLVKQLNIQSKVDFLGFQDNIPEILQKSDIFVLPSKYEAMPMTILEAMACELPVIATNVGGTPFLLSENEGWLVESNNETALTETLIASFENAEDRHKKAANGLLLVNGKYTIEKMCMKYLSLYKSI